MHLLIYGQSVNLNLANYASLLTLRFLVNKTLKQSPAYLISIKKCEDEPLRDFGKRFNAATMVAKDAP
ncbi:hypothetical protein J1N35_002426 [Gossypium stocksii]|uniref:Uncharacterized protein n=1 Tax=Gossypium stocksii TaxID=47602 RepID=A0A9D3WLX0_9ROSI|nr:hypothetical protein J1N35_002426 [Gossypium stocksii]